MHYYQFNIGDYASHTKGLSLMEDLAYRRLMDEYYLNEQALNGCSTGVARNIGMRDHHEEVEYILNRFFTEKDGKWFHKRIEEELQNYKKQIVSKSKAGRASAKARQGKASEQALNSVEQKPTGVEQALNSVEQTNNHKPITNNQKERGRRFSPPSLFEVKKYCEERGSGIDPEQFVNFYQSKGWKVGSNTMRDWKAAVVTWEKRKRDNNNGSSEGELWS